MRGKRETALCLLILIFAVILRIYNGTQKVYFHMDEAYSYGLMNDADLNITDRPDFWNTFHDSGYYLSYLSVEEDEKNDWGPVYENQVRDVHPPLYYLFLRLFAEGSGGIFTKWSGLALNMLLAVCSGILLYQLGNLLTGKRIFGCLACLIGCFSLLSQEMSLYIRMYEMANLAVLAIFRTQLCWLQDRKKSRLILAGIMLVLAGLTHYYCLIFAFGLWLIITLWLLAEKKFRLVMAYQICVLCAAVLFLLIFPAALYHVFGSYRGIGAAASLGNGLEQIKEMLTLLNTYAFHGTGILWILLFLIALTVDKLRRPLILLTVPMGLFILIAGLQAPYREIRYLMPASGLTALWISVICAGTCEWVKNKTAGLLIAEGLVCLMLLAPVLADREQMMEYGQYRRITTLAQTGHPDMIYLFDPSNNRFLDDIYLFTQSNLSYVTDSREVSEESLSGICGQMGDTIWIFSNDRGNETMIEDFYGIQIQETQDMNACRIYLCKKQ